LALLLHGFVQQEVIVLQVRVNVKIVLRELFVLKAQLFQQFVVLELTVERQK